MINCKNFSLLSLIYCCLLVAFINYGSSTTGSFFTAIPIFNQVDWLMLSGYRRPRILKIKRNLVLRFV